MPFRSNGTRDYPPLKAVLVQDPTGFGKPHQPSALRSLGRGPFPVRDQPELNNMN
jgi:hypothetical protein